MPIESHTTRSLFIAASAFTMLSSVVTGACRQVNYFVSLCIIWCACCAGHVQSVRQDLQNSERFYINILKHTLIAPPPSQRVMTAEYCRQMQHNVI